MRMVTNQILLEKNTYKREESMKAITLSTSEVYSGSLILVNSRHPLRLRKNSPLQLVQLEGASGVMMEAKAAALLSQLIQSVDEEGCIVPVSGYRSEGQQKQIYQDSLQENGAEFTAKYVARPGHSEHQTGLAIDLANDCETIDFIRPEFSYTGISALFRQKAAKYGYVERYQKGKEIITGIAHEPWHFRYVGYPHSWIMEENKLSLEEYMEFIKTYPYEGKHFCISKGYESEKGWKEGKYVQISREEKDEKCWGKENRVDIEVFYIRAEEKETKISICEKDLYQVSGNNVDGFILTVWRRNHGND